jgi:uncharacterized protein (DUF2236 family)
MRARLYRAGLYADDSITRRVNRENVLLLGGGRALLMQLAHPKVAAGVDEHSDFRIDPLRRLRRTVRMTMAIVFGDEETAHAAARAVNHAHARVKGEGYRALDPELLLWVHATLVDSALVTYETFVRRLASDEKEAFFEESQLLGTMLGIPRDAFPTSHAAFEEYVARMVEGTSLDVGPTALELSRLVVRPRVLRLPGLVFAPFEVVTAGLLPDRLRADYALPWSTARRRAYSLAVRSVRGAVAVTPPVIRVWPLPGHNVTLGGTATP